MARMFAIAVAALALGAVAAQASEDADPSPIPKAPPGAARAYEEPYRTDTFDLTLDPSGQDGSEIEYLVRMKAGETLVYSWTAKGAPGEAIYSDFHGATGSGAGHQAVSYREGMGDAAAGSLIAPFDGIHGWLFKNDSDKPVTVSLRLAGFYELRSVRETMGLDGPEYVPFGPPGWAHRFGPAEGE